MMLKTDCVSPILMEIIHSIMNEPSFDCFRLVGGTNLALRFNHRESTDIDLFTDELYGSLDFSLFEDWLQSNYPYFDSPDKSGKVVFGRSYYVGKSENECVKVDLMYENEKFLFPPEIVDGVRMATIDEISVMKLDAILYGGRKKDFWDIHFLINELDADLNILISMHCKRFPYQHDRRLMIKQLLDFKRADEEPDPVCSLGKKWEVIKLDIIDQIGTLTT